MQTERLVTLSPQVADTGLALDNQTLHTEILEPRCELESRLSASNDQHNGLLVRPLAIVLPLPLLRPRPVLRFLLPKWASQLWEAMETLKTREDRVRFPSVTQYWN